MRHPLPTRAPFSFSQSLTFIRRFPPNREEFVIGDDSITAAIAIGHRAVPFTVRELCPPAGQKAASKGTVPFADLEIDAPDDVPAHEILPRVSAWLGADHDLAAFYASAQTDRHFQPLVRELYGLHHVAFMSLAEIAVYCVMMQRAPIAMAARMKARFLDRFGLRVKAGERHRCAHGERGEGVRPLHADLVQPADNAGERELRAMPELPYLATLDGDEIGQAIRHRVKGPKIAAVVRGVAAIGEPFLRTAPYAEARDALLEIPGVGPFSAGAILLRGLGRMDELPTPEIAADEAKTIYGRAYDPAAIAKRYGAHIGYWSFYVKTGVARQSQ